MLLSVTAHYKSILLSVTAHYKPILLSVTAYYKPILLSVTAHYKPIAESVCAVPLSIAANSGHFAPLVGHLSFYPFSGLPLR